MTFIFLLFTDPHGGKQGILKEANSGGMSGMHPPPAIFQHVFDEYKFFIISNLFDNNKPYALSTHNRKCTNKMHHIW